MARPRTDIEPRILHAARKQFLERGVDGASLRAIAREASTNLGMIHYYFRTKDDLFLAVVEELYVELLGELETILGKEAPIQAKLEQLFLRLGAATQEELDVIRLVVREALASTSRFERLFTRFQQGHLAMLFRAFGDGMRAGEVDPTVPLPMLVIGSLALGGIPQFMRRVAGGTPPFTLLPESKALAAKSVEVLFGGVAPKKK
ncbi:MAG TPA: TetR/AcrR family transcriptional regulator [Polyangiaceae bacterium]|nr:TetR/AcrR family transcriptional regulator [Polyangiaceae bacterium]